MLPAVRVFAEAGMQRVEVIEAEIHAGVARRAAGLVAIGTVVRRRMGHWKDSARVSIRRERGGR